jgi:uncharacterized glyoxalase superfamily protein PhnB
MASVMADVQFPSEYQQVMPYLLVTDPGALIDFMKVVMGAEEKMIMRDEDGTYRHCEMLVGKSVIMFSVSMQDWAPMPAGLFVYVADADAAYKKALEIGATSLMPPGDQPYGRSCGVKDTNGNTWWLTTDKQS